SEGQRGRRRPFESHRWRSRPIRWHSPRAPNDVSAWAIRHEFIETRFDIRQRSCHSITQRRAITQVSWVDTADDLSCIFNQLIEVVVTANAEMLETLEKLVQIGNR